MDMKSRYNDKLNIWGVDLSGEIDIYNADKLRENLHELINKNPASINIDCKNLKYIDSTGLGVLVSALKKVKDYDGEVALKNLKPHIAKIFELTGLSKIMKIEVDEK
jgi:anti-sigma B factor antagonist